MLSLLKRLSVLGAFVFYMQLATVVSAFEMQDMQGHRHVLTAYQGKWVVVNYWATWCPPCLEEVPALVNLFDERQDDVMVIGVVFDYKSISDVEQYVDDMLMSYPVVLGNESIAGQIGPADVLPTTYLYNPLGELVKVKKGIVSRAYLESLMQMQ